MYDHHLAKTGALTVAIGGAAISGWQILLVVALPVLLGALLVRVGFRRRRSPAE
ncbi:hypothetical protein ACFVIM_00405 [Streptomyces sp. NPDC057638]|uniref:hypothetical protein n=1 Tax=Streptomyces sp. NPDC057638 TaxID=3346190 RepID=UPI00369A3342